MIEPQRGRGRDTEGVGPAGRRAGLAAAAHLVEADGEERRDQREARHEREEQGHQAVAPGHAGQHEADDRIEQAEEDHVGTIGAEVLEAAPQHVAQVGGGDALDRRNRAVAAFPGTFHRLPAVPMARPVCFSEFHPHSMGLRICCCMAMGVSFGLEGAAGRVA